MKFITTYLIAGIVWIGAVVLIGIDAAPEVHPSRWVLGGVAYLTSITVALAIAWACVMAPIMTVCHFINKRKGGDVECRKA